MGIVKKNTNTIYVIIWYVFMTMTCGNMLINYKTMMTATMKNQTDTMSTK